MLFEIYSVILLGEFHQILGEWHLTAGHDLRLNGLVVLISCLLFEFFWQKDYGSKNFHFCGVLKAPR